MVNKYFEKIESVISSFSEIIDNYTTQKKIYNDTQGLISGEIDFKDDSELQFSELKDIEQNSKLKYKYHYMDKKKELLFRYDNAKHYQNLKTFPHHKHTPNVVLEAKEPELIDVLIEIQDTIIK